MKKRFYDPLYFATVILTDKSGYEYLGGSTYKETITKGKEKYVEYFINVEKKNFYTLQHECVHLVKHIFVDRGIPFTAENDEVIAYYLEYWFKRLWRAINK